MHLQTIDVKYGDVLLCVKQLTLREWQRLLHEPSRIAGMLAQPILFLAVFGLGFHSSFRLENGLIRYVDFFFPGILGLVVLFSSIYATLTLVEDKKCGFFRLVLIGPGGVFGAVIGKICATFSLGFLQSLLFLPLALLLGMRVTVSAFLLCIMFLMLGSLVFSVMGVLFAWLSPSPSAFHALMSIILIPMWLLSGAMFPLDNGVFTFIGFINPMAYLVFGLRMCLLGLSGNFGSSLFALSIFLVVALILLLVAVNRRAIE